MRILTEVTVYVFLSDCFVKTVSKNKHVYNIVMATVVYTWKLTTSQVVQVTWLISQLINPNNLHVSRNLSILIVA